MARDYKAMIAAHEAVKARDSVHVVTDSNGDERTLNTDAPFVGNDVSVSAYTECQYPDIGYRRDYTFAWQGDDTLVYVGCTCGHGGMPVKKEYPCPEVIRDLIENFFDGVTVESPFGFNQAHSH